MMRCGLSVLAVVNLVLLVFSATGFTQGGVAPGGSTPRAEVRQIKVQPDLAPDCSSLKAIAESVTRGCANNDEKAVAIYNFMILSHYHLQYPSEKGLSALKEINVYGWSLCGGLHSVQSALWRELGWKWRFVGWSKPGHTTVEAEYDGKWHYLDVFLKYYAWMPDPDAPGGRRIAGQDELQKDSKALIKDALVFDNSRKVWYAKDNPFVRLGDTVNWTAPAFLVCGDSPDGVISGVNSRGDKGSPEAWADIQHATEEYSTDINLAPGYSLTSTWNPVTGAWYWANGKAAPAHSCNNKDFRNSPENGPLLEPYLMPGRDRRGYANGMLVFRPDFSSEDVLASFAAAENVKVESGTLVPADPGKPASVVVPLRSPYPMTLAGGEAEGIEKAEISTDGGKQWKDVALQDFGAAVKGAYSALLRLTFRAALEGLHVEATVQNNPCVLPYLSPGRNVVRVSVGDKGALGGNRLVVTYAFCPGSRSKTYEQLCDEGNEVAKAHGASWAAKPVYVRREFLAKDLPAEFEINIPTPKGKQPVYPRMVFVRREVLSPGAEPLPLPEGAVEFKPDPAGELKSLPNPFRIGTAVPSKPVPREVVTRTLELKAAEAAPVVLRANRHAAVSDFPSERDQVGGNRGSMKIKYFQEFGLVGFDASALKGRKIKSAVLCVKPAGGHTFNLNGGTDLAWISVSTISQEWDVRKVCANRSGVGTDWGWAGARIHDVVLGNGNSLRCNGRLQPAGGVHKMKVDPALVEALVAGASHGLFIADGSTSHRQNCRISGDVTIEVETGEGDALVPAMPGQLRAEPASNLATPELGAVTVSVLAPKDAFAYDIRVNGQPLPRWQIPFAVSGEPQVFPIVDLPPSADVRIEVVAVDAAGNRSQAATVSCKSSPALTVPRLPEPDFKPVAGEPKSLAGAKVYAFPEVTEIDAVTGNVLHEGQTDFRRVNPVWDGASGTIRLAAARGEIASFQIAIEGAVKGVTLALSDLVGEGGTVPKRNARLWRNWYVKNQPEYALPLTGPVDCPMEDNAVTGQTHQAVTVDYFVPPAVKPGNYSGTVTLEAAGGSAKLPLKIQVYSAVIPDDIHFNPELNCYAGPGKAGSDKFKDSFRLAHYNRCTINRVPYSQGGKVHDDYVPAVDGSGKVTSWDNFDQNLGGLLDGSWFKDNPRSGVPVASLYLPQFEGWPLDYQKHYNPGPGIPPPSKNSDDVLKHHILARPVEESFDPAFRDAFVKNVGDFVEHARRKGWNRTLFQCYLNNKPTYGYTRWTLDEPAVYRDWEALNFFGALWKQAIADPAVYSPQWHEELFRAGLAGMKRDRPTFLFRGDISRPTWQGSLSDGLMNVMYVGGGGFTWPRLIRNHKRRMPTILYAYGACAPFEKGNWDNAAWCLKAYAFDSDGVLPWQSLGNGLNNPDAGGNGNALVVDAGERYGHAIGSLRLHGLRRGAQDCELLRLLQLRNGWSRQHIGLLVAQKVPLASEYKQRFVDDAGAATFGGLSSQGFVAMKEGVLKLLE